MKRHFLSLSLVIFCLAPAASATPINYLVSVNTSSIAGTSGSLDFQFNPGPLVTQSALLQVMKFSSDGTLIAPAFPTGDVTGTLPATLAFDNGSPFNDYFTDFTYGSTISFELALSGPALSAPDGTSTSGSTFAFSMFSDSAGTVPVLTSDTTDGFAFTVDVNLDGTTTVTNYSAETGISQVGSVAAPEPATTATMAGALLTLIGLSRRRRVRLFAALVNP